MSMQNFSPIRSGVLELFCVITFRCGGGGGCCCCYLNIRDTHYSGGAPSPRSTALTAWAILMKLGMCVKGVVGGMYFFLIPNLRATSAPPLIVRYMASLIFKWLQ